MSTAIKDSRNLLDTASTPENYDDIFKKIKPCATLFTNDPASIPREHANAIQSILTSIEFKTAAKLTGSIQGKEFEKVHASAEINLYEFLEKSHETYRTPTFSLGAITDDEKVKELYRLSAEEYANVVSLIEGDIGTVNYKGIVSGKTTIPEFYAQYNKAIIYHAKIKDVGQAVTEYQRLLEMVTSYEGNKKTEAETIISPGRIQSRINLLTAFLKNPSGASLRAEVDLKEQDGETVTVVLDGSSITDYKLEGSQSTATLRIFGPDGSAAELAKPTLKEGEALPFIKGAAPWIIEKITSNSIILKPTYKDHRTTIVPRDNRNGISIPIKVGDKFTTQRVVLENVELHNEAHIIVSPNIEKAFSAARFNLHIPIEKRALGLPLFSASIESEIEKTERLLESLDETLEKVGKIHDAWKKFCFGVFTAIAAWNFLKAAVGSGSGRAKDRTSEIFWEQQGAQCGREGLSMDECVFKHEDAYNRILSDTEEAYEYASKDKYTGELSGLKKNDTNKAQMEELAYLQKRMLQNASAQNTKNYLNAYTNSKKTQDHDEALKTLYGGKGVGELSDAERSKLELAVAERNADMFKDLRNNPQYSDYKGYLDSIDISQRSVYLPKDNKVFVGHLTEFTFTSSGLKSELERNVEKTWISRQTEKVRLENPTWDEGEIKAKAEADILTAEKSVKFAYPSKGGLILFPSKEKGAKSLLSPDGETYILSSTSVEQRIEHKPIVTYYTDGPNAGKIHRMSIDATHYAEIDYTSGGRMLEPKIFGRTEPNAEIRADDSEFGGEGINAIKEKWKKDGKDASDLNKVESCVGTINKAKASKRDLVICNGINYAIRRDPAIKGPSCVEFYSPTECKLLFNACDPVLCPPTRFDLGGKWKVDNVAETGIIGSTILGLHNFGIPGTDIGLERGGQVVMPICITGIYAGLQNIRTVLMEYSDCLKRSLVDDESVGICDMLRSYYICDVLWKEAIAIFNIKSGLVGTALKAIHGEGEGSEYTDIVASMDQSINGLKYFTQGYAKNTFAQFSGGALPEIGAEVCKAAVYGKIPGVGSFTDRLMQPESPPQFTAIMDVVPYSDIPFPPQSTYKVYYRIFAGANEPISFSVYLKHQSIGGQSGLPIAWLVRNKRIDLNAFDSENIDFNAPEGYNQVCMAYSSPTYGVREECGFGKTTSGFAVNYVAQKMAEKEAGQGEIQTAEQCNPSGSSLSGPYSGYGAKAGAVAVGGFSSGLLETGITRVCSTFPPGEEIDWKQVGECWEGDKANEGRHLGYCWLHLPSAEKIITKYSVNKDIDWNNFEETLPNATQGAVDRISEYIRKLGLKTVYLTTEDIEAAEKRIETARSNGTEKGFEEAANIYRDVIDNGVLSVVKQVELRLGLADLYREWASLMESEEPKEEPKEEPNGDSTDQEILKRSQMFVEALKKLNDGLDNLIKAYNESDLKAKVDCTNQEVEHVSPSNPEVDQAQATREAIKTIDQTFPEVPHPSQLISCLDAHYKEERTEELILPQRLDELKDNLKLFYPQINQQRLIEETSCLTGETKLVPITNFEEINFRSNEIKKSSEKVIDLLNDRNVQSCLAANNFGQPRQQIDLTTLPPPCTVKEAFWSQDGRSPISSETLELTPGSKIYATFATEGTCNYKPATVGTFEKLNKDSELLSSIIIQQYPPQKVYTSIPFVPKTFGEYEFRARTSFDTTGVLSKVQRIVIK